MSQENVEVVRRGQQAFSHGDLSPAEAMVDDDVDWGTLGDFPGLETSYRGPQGLDRWMDAVRAEWESFEVSIDEVIRDEGDVIVIAESLRGRGRESGAEVEMVIFSTYWFREGKITKRRVFTSREQALEAARRPG